MERRGQAGLAPGVLLGEEQLTETSRRAELTCTCGGSLIVEAATEAELRNAVEAFHAAHEQCRWARRLSALNRGWRLWP
jgi:hypothetical protein